MLPCKVELMMPYRKLSLLCLLILCLAGATSEDPLLERANGIRENATITYTGHYEVACPLPVVKAALKKPLMMGALWTAYRYSPAYEVSALDGPTAAHVKDPTGLVGDVWFVQDEGRRLVYLAEGTLDHWAVPVLNEGTTVFDVDLAPTGAGTQMTVTVSMLPESRIARAVLWTLTPIVKARIESRVSNNFRDAARILETIATTPDEVAQRLTGNMRREFEQAFQR